MLAGAAPAVVADRAGLGGYLAARAPVVAADATLGLAVLLVEHQGDSTEAYVTDGITDETVGDARTCVTSWWSRAGAERYAWSGSTPAALARALGVRCLLTGTVRVAGSGAERRVVVRPATVDATPDGRAQRCRQAPLEAEFRDGVGAQTASGRSPASPAGACTLTSRPRRRTTPPSASSARARASPR